MATTNSSDIRTVMNLMAGQKLTTTQQESVGRIVDAWRAGGRRHSVAVDDGDLAVLRAMAARFD